MASSVRKQTTSEGCLSFTPTYSRHPSLSRAPLDHVHSSLYGFDAESVPEFLEGLTFFPLWHSSRSQRPEQRNGKLCHVEWTLRGPNVQIFDIKCMPTSATTSALPNLVTYPDPHRRRANEMAAAMDAVGVDGEMLVSSIGARPQ